MAASENVLLQRFVEKGDAQAFNEIVRRHAGLVYGACLRVLADADAAADIVQETFLQLLRNAGRITGSVPTWLHRVATNKAVDCLRRDSARRKRESVYAADRPQEVTQWRDLSPFVDEALASLEPQVRDILVAYFLESRTTTDLALGYGVSQPTISRRIESGVVQLRQLLRQRGLLVAGTLLVTLLRDNAVHAAPAVVMQELGKMAMAGGAAAASAGTQAAAGGVLATAKAKAIAVAAAVAIGGGATVLVYNTVAGDSGANTPVAVDPSSKPIAPATTPPTAALSLERTEPAFRPAVPEEPIPAETVGPDTGANAGPAIAAAGGNDAMYGAAYGGSDQPMMGGVGFGGFGMGALPSIDFTSPQGTISSFATLLATGDMEQIAACFAPGAADLADLTRILLAPQNAGELMMKQVFESVGGPVQVVEMVEEANGLGVKWLFTVTKPFFIGEKGQGQAFEPGDKFEMDATLVQVNGQWLIAGI